MLLRLTSAADQWHWLEESGHRLENVDQTHLVLASGKLVLQKDSNSRGIVENSFAQIEFPVTVSPTFQIA